MKAKTYTVKLTDEQVNTICRALNSEYYNLLKAVTDSKDEKLRKHWHEEFTKVVNASDTLFEQTFNR